MDWKYKHFTHQAVFRAQPSDVLDAARSVVAESLGIADETTDGFVARGYSAWHPAVATFHITLAPNGTLLAVELLVERAAGRGYMLVDIGGYYEGRIDKWFTGIAQHLGSTPEQALVNKTTSNVTVRRGCFTGCLVYLVVGACLGAFALLFKANQVPIALAATGIGLLAGIAAYLYVVSPDAAVSKFIRERLPKAPTNK